MYENAHVQMVAIDFSSRRQQEPSISRPYIGLNVLDYKKAGQSDQLVRSNAVRLCVKTSCVFEYRHYEDLMNKG